MSRRLLCVQCGRDRGSDGTRLLYSASELGEPAEYERVVWGHAKHPTRDQRRLYVNGEPIELDLGGFDCDRCGARINPGDRACCSTAFLEGQAIGQWEKEYLQEALGNRLS